MSFERQRRVSELWNWLPAFRAAAEYESIQRASLAMNVSPSAVSRAVKQLEDALGFAVFERQTSGVTLTDRGRRLLDAVRLGMRRVDDALDEPTADALKLGAAPPFLPALLARGLPPAGWSSLLTVTSDRCAVALLRGEIDVGFTDAPVHDERLRCSELKTLPLVRVGHPEADDALPEADAARIGDLHSLLELVRRKHCVTLLPRALVPDGMRAAGSEQTLTIYVVTRPPFEISAALAQAAAQLGD